jgi:hypothetical protein
MGGMKWERSGLESGIWSSTDEQGLLIGGRERQRRWR